MKIRTLAAFLAYMLSGAAASAKPVPEFSAPMPAFSPQPSATTIYCKGVLGQSMQAVKDSAKAPELVTARIDVQQSSHIRINFGATDLLLSVGFDIDGKHTFGPGFAYKILSDDPLHFFAMLDRTKDMDRLQTIALDRVKGTLIWSTQYASFPGMPGNPRSESSFFVCAPNDD